VASGLIALLDDVAALAKVAAASLDDTVAQAARAGVKAAGVVIDDAAVAPRYVMGFAAERELPIVGKIALGSLRNKLLYLLPAALALSLLAPWAITPLLMLGGCYLSYEGAEKIWHKLHPTHAKAGPEPEKSVGSAEDRKVRGAIQTDFILSSEIMAMTLGTVPDASFWVQAVVLATVGIGLTGVVYGGVALIVKADDAGLALSRMSWAPIRASGRVIVRTMPVLLRALGTIGTAAMLWVGGGIILHGLNGMGWGVPAGFVHEISLGAGRMMPLAGVVEWLVTALASALVGVVVGAIINLLVQPVGRLVRPVWSFVRRR
jgi:predicted DNA repair protein MutK